MRKTQNPGSGTQDRRASGFRSGSLSCAESVPCLSIPIFQRISWVKAAISTRLGGISQHPYSALNLAYHVGDAPASVAENRRRFCDALGIDINSLVFAQQIHGDRIAVVDESHAGCGAYDYEDAIPDTDGMITMSHSVALAVLTADCVPVLIVDPIRKAVGIAHAGWRGMLRMIASNTILKMHDNFGTEPADCLVALGPSIDSCCYTVGTDVFHQFQHTFGLVVCDEENRVDLRKAARIQLAGAGVEERNISSTGACTACNPALFYSYRAEMGCTGRMMSVIGLQLYD